MSTYRSTQGATGTAALAGRMSEDGAAHDEHVIQRRLRTVAKATALAGGPLFLLGVLLHPARDGEGIVAAGQLYGITHALQAIGLLLQAVSLVSVYALGTRRFGRGGLSAFFTALVGTLLWFGLIVFDGSHNPVTARYAPELVHTPADLDAGAAILVFPALLLFPVGYALLAYLLTRRGTTWAGLLLGIGAVVYTIGGLAIFALGPRSPVIQILEVAGAVPYALGFVLLGWIWGHAQEEPDHWRDVTGRIERPVSL